MVTHFTGIRCITSRLYSRWVTALKQVRRSAAQLQQLVPDAVLVGGAAAAMYAGHRESFDHDHDLVDLVRRYDQFLEAVEVSGGWATSVRASRPPMTILGSLDGLEAGLRQMLRIKAYLIVQRNYVRDCLDVVALADAMGADIATDALSDLDDYYADRSAEYGSVLTALVEKLAKPEPRDIDVTLELPRYKGLDQRWHEWPNVVADCQQLSLQLVGAD
jgi:hypothetical protein